jgi:hypothetical protein
VQWRAQLRKALDISSLLDSVSATVFHELSGSTEVSLSNAVLFGAL